MGCWGATRECFRSCGKGPHSEHYDGWLARERGRQLNAQVERNEQMQRRMAQLEMALTQTQDILTSYRDLDDIEAAKVAAQRQPSLPPIGAPRQSSVTFAPDADPISRRTSQTSAESKSDFRARIQAGARERELAQATSQLQRGASSNLDDQLWAAGLGEQRSRTLQAKMSRPAVGLVVSEDARQERAVAIARLKQPLPKIPEREFKFSPPLPTSLPPAEQSSSPEIARSPIPSAFAKTHGYPKPALAKAPANP